MKKLNKVLILGVAGACLLTSGMLLSGCKKGPTPITVTTEDGVVLSRYKADTSWTVSNFSQTATTINIPDEYNEMPVTTINAVVPAMAHTVTIGKNIETLPAGLFENSANLTELNYNAIDAEVRTSGSEITPIFSGHTGSEHEGFVLNIGVEVEQIPDYFTVTTESLTNVYNNGVLRTYYGVPRLKEIVLPEDGELKTIGAYAFIGCNVLNQTLNLPSSLEDVEEYAFAFSGISGVLDLNHNIHLHSYAFWNTEITQVNFNGVISNVDNNVFETATLEKAVINSCFETDGGDCFGNIELDIIVNNADIAKLDTIYGMSPNGYANFYITTDLPQAEINSVMLENTTYIDTVIINGEQYYHYQ